MDLEEWKKKNRASRHYAHFDEKISLGRAWNYISNPENCIFRKNCASVPEERSAIPLQTEQSSAG